MLTLTRTSLCIHCDVIPNPTQMLSPNFLSNCALIFVDRSFMYVIFASQTCCMSNLCVLHIYHFILCMGKVTILTIAYFLFPGFFGINGLWRNFVNSVCNTVNVFREQVIKFLKIGDYYFNDIICEVQQTRSYQFLFCCPSVLVSS